MARKTKKANSAVPYVQRLAQDEYVQGQLRNAAERLSDAYERGRRKRGRAVEDKKFYRRVGGAAPSIRKATRRLQSKPKPKRRGRKIALAAAAGGAAIVA